MRSDVLVIDYAGPFAGQELLTDVDLYQYGTIVWDPNDAGSKLQAVAGQNTKAERTTTAVSHRLQKIMEWVAAGHHLIVIANRQKPVSYTYGGSSRTYDLMKQGPFRLIKTESVSGDRIEFCGMPPAAEFFDKLVERLRYTFTLAGNDLIPLLRMKRALPGDDRYVGGMIPYGKGRVYFLPPLVSILELDKSAYASAISELPHLAMPKKAELPDWSGSFVSKEEATALAEIKQIDQQIEKLADARAEQRSKIAEEATIKHLFASSGEQFVIAVKSALEELGLKVVEGPHPRADLLASDGKRMAAIEVKGLDGSSRENDARQTDRWVLEVRSALAAAEIDLKDDPDLSRYAPLLKELGFTGPDDAEIPVKGMMIIGTFRKTPIDLRADDDFPDSTRRAVSLSSHCALTGLQLLGLLLEARNNPESKQVSIDKLFSTNGVLEHAQDWRKFLLQLPMTNDLNSSADTPS